MGNSNSFFIPTCDILDVKFHNGIRSLQGHHIHVTLKNGDRAVIHQDPLIENPFKASIGVFTGRWQSEFLSYLTAVAKENIKDSSDIQSVNKIP